MPPNALAKGQHLNVPPEAPADVQRMNVPPFPPFRRSWPIAAFSIAVWEDRNIGLLVREFFGQFLGGFRWRYVDRP